MANDLEDLYRKKGVPERPELKIKGNILLS